MRTHDFGRGKWVFIDWMGIGPGYGMAWSGEETVAGDSVPRGRRFGSTFRCTEPISTRCGFGGRE